MNKKIIVYILTATLLLAGCSSSMQGRLKGEQSRSTSPQTQQSDATIQETTQEMNAPELKKENDLKSLSTDLDATVVVEEKFE